MDNSKSIFTIFYSWQSDLPEYTNRVAIRKSLKDAGKIIAKKNKNIRVVIDEATRGEAGSPNIPAKILEKIKSSDAFICDITTINEMTDEDTRKTPNPNVIFELGYAVAHLGWERIVMLFNTDFGNFPDDTPFDIDRHRASPYKITKDKENPEIEKENLDKLSAIAIKAIIDRQPKKPSEEKKLSSIEIQRNRDEKNIKDALKYLNIEIIDEMIDRLPRYLDSIAAEFFDMYYEIIKGSKFHIYDKKVYDTLISILESWNCCVSCGMEYRKSHDGEVYIFSNEGDAPLDESQQKNWDEIDKSRCKLKKSIDTLLKILRENYVDIDIDKINREIRISYNKYINEINEKYGLN